MEKKFFIPDENLGEVITKTLKPIEVKEIKPISTGWTNIVFEAITEGEGSYFFRFPRDDFWAKMMVKDYHFCKFIEGKTSFKTPKLELFFDQERPYSVHKKIEGTVLTEKLNELTSNDMQVIAKDVSKFICELKDISQDDLPEECKVTLLDFLDELANVHFSDLSLWQYEYVKSKHTNKHLVHGDLNPGNMIVDENNNLVAVIDFCFAGLGNPYADVSRVIGRSPSGLKKIMINSYEEKTNTKIDEEMLERFVKVWTDIETGYIDYIRNNNPDIKLPSLNEAKVV